MDIRHQYVRPRRHFGRHARFACDGAETLIDVRPDEEAAAAMLRRDPGVAAVQVCGCVRVFQCRRRRRQRARTHTHPSTRLALKEKAPLDQHIHTHPTHKTQKPKKAAPEMSENEANTTAVRYVSRGAVHLEGGWPRDVDAAEAEHTVRYRKKVMLKGGAVWWLVCVGGGWCVCDGRQRREAPGQVVGALVRALLRRTPGGAPHHQRRPTPPPRPLPHHAHTTFKAEKDEDYIRAVVRLSGVVEKAVMQASVWFWLCGCLTCVCRCVRRV